MVTNANQTPNFALRANSTNKRNRLATYGSGKQDMALRAEKGIFLPGEKESILSATLVSNDVSIAAESVANLIRRPVVSGGISRTSQLMTPADLLRIRIESQERRI